MTRSLADYGLRLRDGWREEADDWPVHGVYFYAAGLSGPNWHVQWWADGQASVQVDGTNRIENKWGDEVYFPTVLAAHEALVERGALSPFEALLGVTA